MSRFTFSKNERLTSLKEIDLLFKEGESVSSFPVRLIWKEKINGDPTLPPVQVVFAVTKKKFPNAVQRNRIKRLMRENYRLEKPALFERIAGSIQFNLAIVFTGDTIPEHATIQKAMHGALERWIKKINNPVSPK